MLVVLLLTTGHARAGGPVGVSGASPFPNGCGTETTRYAGAEQQPLVAVNPLDAAHLVSVWWQDPANDWGALGLMAGVSTDGGVTWSRSPIPGVTRCTGTNVHNRILDSSISFGGDGTVYVSAYALRNDGGIQGNVESAVVTVSADGGRTWANPVTVTQRGTLIANGSGTVAADPVVPARAYFMTHVGFGPLLGPSFVHAALFSRTDNGGATWSSPAIVHVTAGATTARDDLVVTADGSLVWVYSEVGVANPMPIMAMRSHDRGATWSLPTRLGEAPAVSVQDPDDAGVRVRTGTGNPVAVASPDGMVHVAWQAISSVTASRIMYASSADNGRTWSAAKPVVEAQWQAFTPAIAAAPDSTVGISFYDFRNDVRGDEELTTEVWLARSPGWVPARVAGPFDMRSAPTRGGVIEIGTKMGLTAHSPGFGATFIGPTAASTDVFFANG